MNKDITKDSKDSASLLLTIDCGNTQTVFGLFDTNINSNNNSADTGLLGHWRIATNAEHTEDELAVLIESFLSFRGWKWLKNLKGFSIASGVPQVTVNLRHLVNNYFDFQPLILEPGVKTGISILYENPKEVGADRIANAVGVHDLYKGTNIVADFGTGTTLDVINEAGEYLGGSISPGIEISLEALIDKAAALFAVELKAPESPIGRTTMSSLQAGTVFGFAAQVDGLVNRMKNEVGEANVIATGGLASLIAPHSEYIDEVEPWLTLHGLRLIWEMNQ